MVASISQGQTTYSGTNSVSTRHPQYLDHLNMWMTTQDCYDGEEVVKKKGTRYLPATSGMITDGQGQYNTPGQLAYDAYKMRAYFPDLLTEAVKGLVGVMHYKPPSIELPRSMAAYLDSASAAGESLAFLLRRINEQQLVTGRCGLMADLDARQGNDLMPYLALYHAKSVINWDDGDLEELSGLDDLQLVVLDETGYYRNGFSWYNREKYRVLLLGDMERREIAGGTYKVVTFSKRDMTSDEITQETIVEPHYRGKRLDFIPFTFINSMDIIARPEKPPLLGLANLSLAIYRSEADYRQALFMQGQDTLVIQNADDTNDVVRLGAGAQINVPADGDAKFIGVSATGLPEMRIALENDYERASEKGSQLLESVSRTRESGEALKIRVAAKTATLNQIALAGARGLEQQLKYIAIWTSANPDEVSVKPNLDFASQTISGEDLVKMAEYRRLGGRLSWHSIHQVTNDRGLTELNYEEELEQIKKENEEHVMVEVDVPLGGASNGRVLPSGNNG